MTRARFSFWAMIHRVYFLKVLLPNHSGLFLAIRVIVLLAIMSAERFSSPPIYIQFASLIGPKAFHIHRHIRKDCAGAWFTCSYLACIQLGLIGVTVSSALYHYIGCSFTSAASAPTWIRLILMNIRAPSAAGMRVYAQSR